LREHAGERLYSVHHKDALSLLFYEQRNKRRQRLQALKANLKKYPNIKSFVHFHSSSGLKISSIRQLNNFAILKAKIRDGLYLPFSNEMIVCLDTSNFSERSSCVNPIAVRISFIKLFSYMLPLSM
jgi:hypothetical protein